MHYKIILIRRMFKETIFGDLELSYPYKILVTMKNLSKPFSINEIQLNRRITFGTVLV